MCGIVGYVGGRSAVEVVVEGLRRLEYRGYDSAGVAIVDRGTGLRAVRKAGPLANLEKELAEADPITGSTGLGHTRWATHGGPVDRNAHPHLDCTGRIAVIHNGIIENHARLRERLETAGHGFTSETDTEVVAHLLEEELAGAAIGLATAMRSVCGRLSGAFTLVVVDRDEPDVVVGARRNSPLVIGAGAEEMFLASDVAAFIAHTRDAVELGQDEVVEIHADGATITGFDGTPRPGRAFHVDWDLAAAEKTGHDFFMLKEIAEQPAAVADTLRDHFIDGRIVLDEERLDDQALRDIDKVFVVACGSAYHSGLIAKYAIEHWTRLPVEVEIASEFRYRDPVLDRDTLVVAVSQSGETADTLEAVRHARDQHARVLSICNTNGAQIPRASDAVLYTRAGPEVAVASTKGFLTQVAASYLVGLALAQVQGKKYDDEVAREFAYLEGVPGLIEQTLSTMDTARRIGRSIADAKTVLFLGRHVGYPVALEGALKRKELSYMHAEGFQAGELKHGPIALIDKGMPVVVVAPPPGGRGPLHDKVASNLAEVRARGAHTIVIAAEGDAAMRALADDVIEVPRMPTLYAPLVTTIPMQVLAAEIAQARGYDVDKPRNLAKSVTVE
ncbi:MAG: glutamine--fructose-6-phosphate transaminase (isomerizing) [Mycobacteriales bacterium]